MSREFTFGGGDLTIANAPVSLLGLNPAAAPNFNIAFRRLWCGQTGSTTSAQQRVWIADKQSVFPTFTAVTPRKLLPADPNASIITGGTAGAAGTCGVNASAEGAGTLSELIPDVFNMVPGFQWIPSPDEVVVYPAGYNRCLVLHLPAAAPSLSGWAVGCNYGEVS